MVWRDVAWTRSFQAHQSSSKRCFGVGGTARGEYGKEKGEEVTDLMGSACCDFTMSHSMYIMMRSLIPTFRNVVTESAPLGPGLVEFRIVSPFPPIASSTSSSASSKPPSPRIHRLLPLDRSSHRLIPCPSFSSFFCSIRTSAPMISIELLLLFG